MLADFGQSQQDDQGDQQLDLPQGGMDSEPESEDENQTESSSQQTETGGFDFRRRTSAAT